jgi:hypothetical protein
MLPVQGFVQEFAFLGHASKLHGLCVQDMLAIAPGTRHVQFQQQLAQIASREARTDDGAMKRLRNVR